MSFARNQKDLKNYQNIKKATRIPRNWYCFLLYSKVPKDYAHSETLKSLKSINLVSKTETLKMFEKNQSEKNT